MNSLNFISRIYTSLLIVILVTTATLAPCSSRADSADSVRVQANQEQKNDSISTQSEIAVPSFAEVITNLPNDLVIWGHKTLEPQNIPVTLGVLGMTAITVATDYESWQAARIPNDESVRLGRLSNIGVSMGDGYFQFSIVGGFIAAGVVSGNNRPLRTAAQLTESILATGIVVQIIKHVTGRESPFSSESRTGVWRVFPNQLEYLKDFQKFDAVPSGHLSTAVTTLVVIQENYPEQKWIPFVGWPVMGLIGYGLAATSIHWWSDFPIAVALGYSFARIVTEDNRAGTTANTTIKRGETLWRPIVLPAFSSEGQPVLTAGWTF